MHGGKKSCSTTIKCYVLCLILCCNCFTDRYPYTFVLNYLAWVKENRLHFSVDQHLNMIRFVVENQISGGHGGRVFRTFYNVCTGNVL